MPAKRKLYTCGCCHRQYYRNEMRRSGLVLYCRYCLDNGMVPGVHVKEKRRGKV